MEPISNADRIVLVLRQKLLERSKSSPAAKSDPKHSAAERTATALENVHALAGIEGVDDHQLERALIQGILTDELGRELINEASFQQVVDRVIETMQAEPSLAELLSRMLGELRKSAP